MGQCWLIGEGWGRGGSCDGCWCCGRGGGGGAVASIITILIIDIVPKRGKGPTNNRYIIIDTTWTTTINKATPKWDPALGV